MSARQSIVALGSLLAGAVLALALLRLGHINLAETLSGLRYADRAAVAELVILNGALIYLSTEKWLKVDAVLRGIGDAAPTRITALFVTGIGMALGLFLPVQLGMAVSRTLSTHFFGRPLRRGTGGTFFEQGFDLLIVIIFAAASFLTWISHGHALIWSVSAILLLITCMAAIAPCLRIIRAAVITSSTRSTPVSHNRNLPLPSLIAAYCRDRLTEIQNSGLFEASLARRLLLLSAARFFVLVLMASCSAQAVRIHVPLWQFCAAMPFATVANLLAITPGGIGVNELASVAALHSFGMPLAAASHWALANRILVSGSCLAAAGFATLLFAFDRFVRFITRLPSGTSTGKSVEEC